MRRGTILAASGTLFSVLFSVLLGALSVALSTTGAGAEGWCGYTARAKAPIECGYSTAAECQSATGKGGVCFIDPEYADNLKGKAPTTAARTNAAALAGGRS